jgi:hypothetical protein
MEAENFLASGYATRQAILSKPAGWCSFAAVARTWQPSRLKGIQVSPEYGTPFLAATQVFDLRPVPRKWLSLDRTEDHAERFVADQTIMLTCSGSVGRATLADASTSRTLISHDLLRIEALQEEDRGWVYAYLRAPSVRAMMTSAQYGHMIKHLEVSHLDALPFVTFPSEAIRRECHSKAARVIAARNEALALLTQAENDFQVYFGESSLPQDDGETGFAVSASRTFMKGRRRFDAFKNNPGVRAIEQRLAASAVAMQSLRAIGCAIWLPNRFRRVPADDGVELVDSSSLFEINPDHRRKIAAEGISDRNKGFVKPDWLLMSRSGQVYGLLGSVVMASASHVGKVVTDDVIRIDAKDKIDPGYLHLVLSHEVLARPRVKAMAYGSSIPHIEVEDLLDFEIPRLTISQEATLGQAVRQTYDRWSEADALENELSETAESWISEFLAR